MLLPALLVMVLPADIIVAAATAALLLCNCSLAAMVAIVTNSTRKSKNRRDPTRMLKIWAIRDGELLPQEFNEFDQPIGDDATKFTNFLGTVVRNGNDAPLVYKDWRQVPSEYKEKLWNIVKLKYDIEEDSMSWVMKALGKKWKDFKVLPDQWKYLIDFWNSEEGEGRSVRNRINRLQQITLHTAGSKSFARIREEESDIDKMSIDNPENANKSLKEGDLFLEVFGKERHGHVRGLGLGPCPSDIWSSMPSRATSVRMAYEAKRKAEAEIRAMQEKMTTMEEEQIELKVKLAKMEAKMDAWQRSPNDFHQSNSMNTRQNVANANEDGINRFEREEWSSSSSSTHAIPTHRIHYKKMRSQQEISRDEVRWKRSDINVSGKPHRPVARGILFSRDPSTIVGGERLGQQYWDVYVEVAIMPNESLIRNFQNLKTIGDAARKSIAWPSFLVKEDGR
uniref:Transposase Tnp1/En/Spm-like domain-containing protein n=1 Tax=Ananas comosus var. bracteatus TaxID=296719 RepID=A0A6V7PV85_ANACO|nr:unnamed protein product [Ananas comosus var. bracteatus]